MSTEVNDTFLVNNHDLKEIELSSFPPSNMSASLKLKRNEDSRALLVKVTCLGVNVGNEA